MNNLTQIILIVVIAFMLLGCSCSCFKLESKEGFAARKKAQKKENFFLQRKEQFTNTSPKYWCKEGTGTKACYDTEGTMTGGFTGGDMPAWFNYCKGWSSNEPLTTFTEGIHYGSGTCANIQNNYELRYPLTIKYLGFAFEGLQKS